jgi:hypothetical protein
MMLAQALNKRVETAASQTFLRGKFMGPVLPCQKCFTVNASERQG